MSKLATERRRAARRVRSAFAHVLAHAPPLPAHHALLVSVTSGRAVDAAGFAELCADAEAALARIARGVVASENAIRKKGRPRKGSDGPKGAHGADAARKRDAAKRRAIWKGTGVQP